MLVDITLEAYSGLLVFPELGLVDWGAKVGERGRQLTCSWRPYYSLLLPYARPRRKGLVFCISLVHIVLSCLT